MPELEVGDEEFIAIARDPARARALRETLRKLARAGGGSGDGALREMAREVLAGRVGLREAMQVGPYREALRDRARAGARAYEDMSAPERAAAEAEGRRRLEAYGEEIDRERAVRRGAG
ncbi:hypothetical protein [Streptomyces sp. NBC_01262]|uniref:hypothetical protein n=1 Tax=Streptomyces sp. NBC_01262 TaxID=2903803 RepID=UPI002E365B76|nr:hypothetical protein [Streptomyces sp. NBC_01262]